MCGNVLKIIASEVHMLNEKSYIKIYCVVLAIKMFQYIEGIWKKCIEFYLSDWAILNPFSVLKKTKMCCVFKKIKDIRFPMKWHGY